jgi:hypothetical protein
MLGSLPYSRNMSDQMWDGAAKVWVGGCWLKQNLGGIKPIAPYDASCSRFIWFID